VLADELLEPVEPLVEELEALLDEPIVELDAPDEPALELDALALDSDVEPPLPVDAVPVAELDSLLPEVTDALDALVPELPAIVMEPEPPSAAKQMWLLGSQNAFAGQSRSAWQWGGSTTQPKQPSTRTPTHTTRDIAPPHRTRPIIAGLFRFPGFRPGGGLGL